MPTIRIQGVELSYSETDVVTFEEGLIGLPHLRRMVLVRQAGLAPFLWLASPDDADFTFLVVDPRQIFEGYDPHPPGEERGAHTLVLSIVRVAADWRETTVNLRAPIFIDPVRMRGTQAVLSEGSCRHDQPLPPALIAA